MIFQVSNFKGKYFLISLDNKLFPIEPSYIKRDPWIKHFRYLNLLCVRATKAITNHTLVEEYYFQSSPERILVVYIKLIQLKLDITYSTIVRGLTTIRT